MHHLNQLNDERMKRLFYVTPQPILPRFQNEIQIEKRRSKALDKIKNHKVIDPRMSLQDFSVISRMRKQDPQSSQNSVNMQSSVEKSKSIQFLGEENKTQLENELEAQKRELMIQTKKKNDQSSQLEKKLKTLVIYKQGCPSCGSSKEKYQSISNKNFICKSCQKFLKNPQGDFVRLEFEDNQIVYKTYNKIRER